MTTLPQRVDLFQLPTEVLCRIFFLSLSPSSLDLDFEESENSDVDMEALDVHLTTPFTLSAICSRWRNIVRADPRLWSSVRLFASITRADIQGQLLQEWLKHSGALPLTIEIDCEESDWHYHNAHLALPIMRPISVHSDRCVTFRTSLPPYCLSSTCLPLPLPEFSKLSSLSLLPRSAPDEEETGEPEVLLNYFSRTRALRQLHLQVLDSNLLAIDHKSLVKLTVSEGYYYNCIEILRNARVLEECTFKSILYSEEEPDPVHQPIYLPNLRYLSLQYEFSPVNEVVLPNIMAPKLDSLVYHQDLADEFPLPLFAEFVLRSRCGIRNLTIRGATMTSTELEQIIDLVRSTLIYLELDLVSPDAGEDDMDIDPADGQQDNLTMEGPVRIQDIPNLVRWKIAGPRDVYLPVFGGIIPAEITGI